MSQLIRRPGGESTGRLFRNRRPRPAYPNNDERRAADICRADINGAHQGLDLQDREGASEPRESWSGTRPVKGGLR
jgi:hypothetical protein